MAQLAIAAVGAAIGGVLAPGIVGLGLTGAQIGWAVGAAVGSMFGPKHKSQGPRLNDLSVTGSDYGQAIPYCVGRVRTAGQIVWASEKHETATTTEQGKGGGSEFTEYTYDVDLLILLTENQIEGVSRVWANGELVYDGSMTKENTWSRLTVYTGASDQLPDPTYEAAVGSANAPAYRGRGSVFIEGLQLGSSGQLPNLTFELNPGGESGVALDVPGSLYDDVSAYNRSPTVNTGNPGTIDASGNYIEMVSPANEQYSDYVTWAWTAGAPASSDPADLDVDFWMDSTHPACYLVRSPWISVELVRTNGPTLYHLRVINEVEHTSHLSAGTGNITGLFALSEWHTLSVRWNGRLPVCTIDGGQVSLTDGGAGFWGTGYTRFDAGPFYREDGAAEEKHLRLRNITVTVAGVSAAGDCTPLSTLVGDLCERAGLTASDYDTSDLVTASSPGFSAEVCAFFISDVSPTRASLDVLMSAYAFDCAKSDKLYFRFRQTTAADDIEWEDLDASDPGAQGSEPLEITLANELEVPSQMAVTYRNLEADFQVSTEFSDRLLSGQESTNVVQLPLGLYPAEARKVADLMLYDQVAGMTRATFSVPLGYAALEPTDVVNVTNDEDDRTYRLRIVSKKDGGNVFTFEGVVDESTVSSLVEADADSGLVDADYPSQTQVTSYALTSWEMLDIPLLRDADDAPGWYAAAKKTEGETGTWPGAALLVSVDQNTYTIEATFTGANVFGTCQTVLGDWTGGEMFDETNTVTVDVGSGELSSSTRDAMHADSTINVMLIGDEIIRFRLATLISTGVYRLSGLLRGQRGTEWAISGHASSSPPERCVLLSTNIRRAEIDAADIDLARYWKAVTTGKAVSSADYGSETNTGVCLKPFSPTNLRRTVDSAGAVTFTWDRRTRLLAENCLAGSVPLGEQSEEYEVELLDVDGEVLLEDTVTSAQWTPGSSSGALGVSLVTCAWALQFVGGELYGIPEESLAGTGSRRVTRFDQTSGAILAQSASLGASIWQTALVGTSLALVCNSYNGAGGLSEGAVRLVTLSTLAVAAEYIAPTASNPAGIAYDGSALWMTERTSGKVRELNASTLASVADYALQTGIEACFYDAGSLYICSPTTNQIIEWDVVSHTEVQRFSCVAYPFDVRVVGSLIYVQGMSQVGVYNMSGIPQAYHTIAANSLPQRFMVPYGSNIAVLNQGSGGTSSQIKTLVGGTGLELETTASPYYRTLMISGDTTGNLWVAGQPSAASASLASATLGEVSVETDGALLRVYQMSATVGRGYVAELSLE